jgi:hypothetical protein
MFRGNDQLGIPPVQGLAGAALLAIVTACTTRERLTFGEPPVSGTGPVTTVYRPSGDTTVAAGPALVVQGNSRDPDGIDTLYVEVVGGVTTFPPFPGDDSLFTFDLPVTTNGQAGQTITIRLFATDELGNRGDTVTRRITVQ